MEHLGLPSGGPRQGQGTVEVRAHLAQACTQSAYPLHEDVCMTILERSQRR